MDIGPDIPIFLICEVNGVDVAGVPIFLFSGKYGAIMTSIPQPGPAGGIFHISNLSSKSRYVIFERLIDRIIQISKKNKCLLFSSNTNQIIDDSLIYKKLLMPQYIFNNFTQFIDLDKRQCRSSSLNYNVNSSMKNGLKFFIDDEKLYFDKWYKIHVKRNKEIGIEPLNKILFHSILKNKNNVKLACVILEDKIISGCVFIFHKKILDIYMISFDSDYAKIKPNYFCIESLTRFARSKGIKYFNWQSSNFIGSGVYKFKKSWGSKHSDYQILTKLFINISELRKIGLSNIIEAYPNHYLLPYDAMIKTNNQKIFFKQKK